MTKGTRWILLCLGTLLLGCESPFSNSEYFLLSRGQRRWAGRGFTDYTIESRQSCFCPPEVGEWATLVVVGGRVQRVTLLRTGEVITDVRRQYWITVEQLFGAILESRSYEDLEDVDFSLDQEYGYPTFVRWKYGPNVIDAGGTHSFRNVKMVR